jgi:hypothetical protein
MKEWVAIPDHWVHHVYREAAPPHRGSPVTPAEEVWVDPTFYQDSGNPISEDGDELEYLRTEIDAVALMHLLRQNVALP